MSSFIISCANFTCSGAFGASKLFLTVTFIVCFLYIITSVCNSPQCFATNKASQGENQQGFPIPTVCISEEQRIKDELQAKVTSLFANNDFDQLEKIAQQLIASKAQYPDGIWKLHSFYQALSAEKVIYDKSYDWNGLFSKLKLWTTKKPTSVTPRIAYAKALRNYAWNARGGGWGDTVSAEGWNNFSARLKLARSTIDSARRIKTNDPELLDVSLCVALGDETSRSTYETIFNQAISQEPTFYSYYFDKTLYLLPRWHGEEGEWQKFAKNAADKIGGDAGDILYARIVWFLQKKLSNDDFVSDPRTDKIRMLRGFYDLEIKYPQSLWVLSAECFMNVYAKSPSGTKRVMDKLKNRVDLSVWPTIDYFKNVQNWFKQHP